MNIEKHLPVYFWESLTENKNLHIITILIVMKILTIIVWEDDILSRQYIHCI